MAIINCTSIQSTNKTSKMILKKSSKQTSSQNQNQNQKQKQKQNLNLNRSFRSIAFIFLICFNIFLSTPLLLALEAVVEIKKDKQGTEKTNQEADKDKQTIEIEDSSATRRMNKKFSITTELSGYGPFPGSIFSNRESLILGYFLDFRNLVNLELRNFPKGHIYTGLFFASTDDIASGHSVGLHFKHFVGSSFYFTTGLDFMKYQYQRDRSYFLGSCYDCSGINKNAFSGESIMANFTIGNQWQWENFTLGCDWFGLVRPVSSRLFNETNGDNGTDYLNSEKQTFTKYGLINLLRFYLGVAF